MFTEKDIDQIRSKQIDTKTIEKQINNFRQGFAPAKLCAAATIGNGLIQFNDNEVGKLKLDFDKLIKGKSILKFVPASGAASRMFKQLFEFYDTYTPEKEEALFAKKDFNSVHYFFEHLSKFAFYQDLNEVLKKDGHSIEELLQNKAYKKIISALLDEKGLNYARLPKGLLKFHNYADKNRMSIEEHLEEGAIYSKDENDTVRIHFTVSPEHMEKFKDAIRDMIGAYEEKYGVSLNISFSIQKPSTDMLAVDMKNDPFRNAEGNLLFRPGGHGALIENLNDLEADVIFIKNIDNIVPDRIRETTYTYKKVIAAYLIQLQNQSFEYLRVLDNKPGTQQLNEIEKFAKEQLLIHLADSFESDDKKAEYLHKKLNRPIRICGMVKNEGEPGGGPFWVENEEGDISLQIIESSQMNLNISSQEKIAQKATHFNPVDLVCGVFDYKGNKFDLKEFVNPNTGFISEKSQNGRDLKAQELPGLWNGAMANWITIFVECPIITFNPVKIVNDLLREQHQ
jgi:hypothetical protein